MMRLDLISTSVENHLDYIEIKALLEGRTDILRKIYSFRTFVKLNPYFAKIVIQNLERDLDNTFEKKGNSLAENHNGRIMLQDRSNDPNVSFKFPAFVPKSSSFIFISAHEGEHVRDIIRKAVLEGKLAMVFVRYLVSYDSEGKLYISGGLTWGKIIDFLA